MQFRTRISRYRARFTDLMRFELERKKRRGKKRKEKVFHAIDFEFANFCTNFNWPRYITGRVPCVFFVPFLSLSLSFFPFSLASYFRCKIHVDTLRMRAFEGTNYDRQLPRWNVTFANIFWFECRQALKVLYPDVFLPSPMLLPRVLISD